MKAFNYIKVFFFALTLLAGNFCSAMDLDNILLVFDAALKNELPRNYRNAHRAFNLRISGSAQYSEAMLTEIIKRADGAVYVVDLRQESHGFVNGIPITWYSTKNSINNGKPRAEIVQSEMELLNNIKKRNLVEINRGHKMHGGLKMISIGTWHEPTAVVETEESLVNRYGVRYKRFFIADHHRPEDSEVDEFIKFTNGLPKNAWLHFHCRGGRGRATTFMAMYDILKNSHILPLRRILNRQTEIGGRDLLDVTRSEEHKWKEEQAKARLDFLIKFYNYSKNVMPHSNMSWSVWTQNQNN